MLNFSQSVPFSAVVKAGTVLIQHLNVLRPSLRGSASLHRCSSCPQTETAQTSFLCQRRRKGHATHTLRSPHTPWTLAPGILPWPRGALWGWRGQHRASRARRPLRLEATCVYKTCVPWCHRLHALTTKLCTGFPELSIIHFSLVIKLSLCNT